jgi:diphosphomevalonate decarboxylase
MEEKLSGKPLDDFFLTASSLSRLGSGSACRSVYGGFCLWGETGALLSSSDLHAVALDRVHPVFYDLQDAILILSNKEKKVSSSRGHERMDVHPYAKSRILHANSNTNILLKALQEGDIDTFIQVTENEALTLHALMMTSQPGFMLMEPESVRIIRQIQAFRENTGLKVCYTLDAGPNVHLLFFKKDFEQVKRLIVEDLIINDKQNSWIHDKCGSGPQKVNQAFR